MVLDLIIESSENFGRQCSAVNASCYYQSRFLSNIVSQYRKSKAESTTPGTERPKPQNPLSQQGFQRQQQLRRPADPAVPDPQRHLYPISTLSCLQMQQPLATDSLSHPQTPSKHGDDAQPLDPMQLCGAMPAGNSDVFVLTDGQNTPFSLFTDNLLWEDLFATAGFNISSGSFLPN
jgi:hypothetical protein